MMGFGLLLLNSLCSLLNQWSRPGSPTPAGSRGGRDAETAASSRADPGRAVLSGQGGWTRGPAHERPSSLWHPSEDHHDTDYACVLCAGFLTVGPGRPGRARAALPDRAARRCACRWPRSPWSWGTGSGRTSRSARHRRAGPDDRVPQPGLREPQAARAAAHALDQLLGQGDEPAAHARRSASPPGAGTRSSRRPRCWTSLRRRARTCRSPGWATAQGELVEHVGFWYYIFGEGKLENFVRQLPITSRSSHGRTTRGSSMTVEVFYPGEQRPRRRGAAGLRPRTLLGLSSRSSPSIAPSITSPEHGTIGGEHPASRAAAARRGSTRSEMDRSMKRALITGITGQDGSYLAEFLLGKPDYEVHGLVRRSSSLNRQRIDHLFTYDPAIRDRFHLHYADLADASSLSTVMEQVRPDEVYNLGAQSHVRVSFDQPLYTADVVGLGTLRLLEAVRQLNRSQPVKFYQASSSEMFGSAAAAAGARHAVPPPQPLRLRQALCPLADDQLSRGLRPVRLLGDPLQPREPPPRRVVRDPEGHPGRRPDQGGAAEASWSWATWTPSATGASPATTSGPCG